MNCGRLLIALSLMLATGTASCGGEDTPTSRRTSEEVGQDHEPGPACMRTAHDEITPEADGQGQSTLDGAENGAARGAGAEAKGAERLEGFSLSVGAKPPEDKSTGLVVRLVGFIPQDLRSSWPRLYVCGVQAAYHKDGRFETTRSFPAAGGYDLLAHLMLPGEQGECRTVATATCRVTLTDREGEDDRLRGLAARAFGPTGVTDESAYWQLLQSKDLRTAPALWLYLDSQRHQSDERRTWAIWALGGLGSMWHIDSVPRFVPLLDDAGVGKAVQSVLRDWGFAFEHGGGFMTPMGRGPSWNPYIELTDAEYQRLVRMHLPEWRRREPRLRALLHQ